MEHRNIKFLEPFLVDPQLLSWHPDKGASDLTHKVIGVLSTLKNEPASLEADAVRDIVWDEGSQIGSKDQHWAHISNTGEILGQMSEQLRSLFPGIGIPHQDVARSYGLVHDLSASYARYEGRLKQQDKELTLFFHARHMGLDNIAKHVAMHSAYWEILEMIHAGKGFEGINIYSRWRAELRNPTSPFRFKVLQQEFEGFLNCRDNLQLMLTTVADHAEHGSPHFKASELNENFEARTRSIIDRYFTSPILAGKNPIPLGTALMIRGGLERVVAYKRIVGDLLNGIGEPYQGLMRSRVI